MRFHFAGPKKAETEIGFLKNAQTTRHRDILPSNFILKRPPRVVIGPFPNLTEIKAKHMRHGIVLSTNFVPEFNITI